MQDSNLPSRQRDTGGYGGLFGRDPAFDPIKLLVLTIVLLLILTTVVALYHECVLGRKRAKYRPVYSSD